VKFKFEKLSEYLRIGLQSVLADIVSRWKSVETLQGPRKPLSCHLRPFSAITRPPIMLGSQWRYHKMRVFEVFHTNRWIGIWNFFTVFNNLTGTSWWRHTTPNISKPSAQGFFKSNVHEILHIVFIDSLAQSFADL